LNLPDHYLLAHPKRPCFILRDKVCAANPLALAHACWQPRFVELHGRTS
jgi:hypothetical protein